MKLDISSVESSSWIWAAGEGAVAGEAGALGCVFGDAGDAAGDAHDWAGERDRLLDLRLLTGERDRLLRWRCFLCLCFFSLLGERERERERERKRERERLFSRLWASFACCCLSSDRDSLSLGRSKELTSRRELI